MDATLIALKKVGVEIEETLERFCGNEALYLRLLKMFEEDNNMQAFLSNYESQDYEKAIFHVHTLKGVSANLGFSKVSNGTQLILNELKINNFQIDDLVAKLKEEYAVVLDVIKQIKKTEK